MSTSSPATGRIPGPLPLWYLAVLFVIPVAVIGSWDLVPTDEPVRWIEWIALLAAYYYVEKWVHHKLGVDRRLQFVPSVFGYTLGFAVAMALIIIVAMGLLPGVAFTLPAWALGVLLGVALVGGALLEHHLIRRASAKVAPAV